jgi:hypothetical protein
MENKNMFQTTNQLKYQTKYLIRVATRLDATMSISGLYRCNRPEMPEALPLSLVGHT